MDHFFKLNDSSIFTPFSITNSGGLVDRIPDCHAGRPGSNPWLGSTLFGGLIRQSLLCLTDLDPKNSRTKNSLILDTFVLLMLVIFIITSKCRKNWSLYSWADCLRFQDKRNRLTSMRLLSLKRSFKWAKTLLSNHRIIVATHEEKIIKQISC